MNTQAKQLFAATIFAAACTVTSAQEAATPAPPSPVKEARATDENLASTLSLVRENRKLAIQKTLEGMEKSPANQNWGMALVTIAHLDAVKARTLESSARKELFTETQDFLTRGRAFLQRAREQKPDDISLSYQMKAINAVLATASLESGKTVDAKRLAEDELAANGNPKDWNYGNVIHQANALLGRAALREGDKQTAADYLLKAGSAPGSPQLNSFGPDFTFAQEMIEAGESTAVLSYLDLVQKFWVKETDKSSPFASLSQDHLAKLDAWRAEIRAGKVPKFR